jgi:LCP family protein required for cell wall assembly
MNHGTLRSRRRALVILAVLTLTLSLLVGTAFALDAWLRAPINEGETINILLLGSDEGPGRNSDPLRGRADAFHLVSISPERDQVTFVSFPRDAYVAVPGRGNTRINACLTAGPENCMATVEANWGFRPDHYVVTNMHSFKQAIHRFGGVEVDVQSTVSDGGTPITQTGPQRITGSQALAYARDRKNRAGGDFARAEAQTRMLRAGHRAVFDSRASARVAHAVAVLQQTTMTDMSPDQLLRMAFLAADIDPADIDQVTLQGNLATIGGASMVRLTDGAHATVRSVAADGRQ